MSEPRWLARAAQKGWMAVLVCCGCGYIGEPLPPALHIPQRVTDLTAVERGSRILVQFSLPSQTTEGMSIKSLGSIELRAGPAAGGAFQADAWAAGAKLLSGVPAGEPAVRYEFPAAEWIGKDIVLGVKIHAANGRSAGWSNFVALSVVPPLARPEGLRPESAPNGVRLTWQGPAFAFRVYRRAGADPASSPIADTERPAYTDTTAEYGRTYHYSLQARRTGGDIRAESEISEEAQITPEDRFPPAVPAGLAGVASTGSMELVWERNTEPDLAGYRVYRAEAAGPFQLLTGIQEAPSYSDHAIVPGKSYRYAVSAVDTKGNESQMSAPVELRAP